MSYVISYDLGTGGVKTSLFNEKGESLYHFFGEYPTYYQQKDFHEQNPMDWWQAIKSTTLKVIEKVEDPSAIVAIGVSGHSLGIVPLDIEGELLWDRVPIWSDGRAFGYTQEFFSMVNEEQWYLETGNGFPSHLYSIFEILWLKENKPDVYQKTHKFIGTKDFINHMLTGVMCTDPSYASGSGVFSLRDWDYNTEFIQASGVEGSKLPDILPSHEVIGEVLPEVAKELGLSPNTKVVCGGVDNSCMALGSGCVFDGASYTSLGSSAWIAVTTKDPIVDIAKKPYVFAHCIEGMYASATAIFSAGSSYKWLRNTFYDHVEDEDAFEFMNQLAESSPVGAKGLFFNPSLAGGSSLDNTPHIRGAYLGLGLDHNQKDMVRATLEGICFNLRVALDVIKSYTEMDSNMLLVGGGGKSEFWRQLFADIYNMNIVQSRVGQDAGALGAAALALRGLGLWQSYEPLRHINKPINKLEPEIQHAEKYNELLEVFKKLMTINGDIGDIIAGIQ